MLHKTICYHGIWVKCTYMTVSLVHLYCKKLMLVFMVFICIDGVVERMIGIVLL